MMYDRKEVLREFCKVCFGLKMEYDLFLSLFDGGEHRKELLASVAPYLFGDLYAILRNSLFVGFCKITDPAGSRKRTNLTTNFIVDCLEWSTETKVELHRLNERMMAFRKYIEPARSRRITHMDLRAQMDQEGPLGAFSVGADEQFFRDLEGFLTVANQELHSGPFQLSVGGSTDTYKLIRQLVKASLYDKCTNCAEMDHIKAILTAELTEL